MALKVELKAGERIILGDCVITNQNTRTRLTIEGDIPILREKDIMTAARADTPAKRIYLAVQLMYTSSEPGAHHDVYFKLIDDVLRAAPSTAPIIETINNHILTGSLYKALKQAAKLIEYEQDLVKHAKRRASLRNDGQQDRQPA